MWSQTRAYTANTNASVRVLWLSACVCVLGPPSGEAVAILIVLSSNVVFVKLYHASELELENF